MTNFRTAKYDTQSLQIDDPICNDSNLHMILYLRFTQEGVNIFQ